MTTTSLTRRARVGACALAAVAALVTAGCGGDDGGGGGSKKDYQSAINTFCSSIKGAAEQVQKDATEVQSTAAKDPKTVVQKFSGALGTFADSTKTALDKFRGAEAPDDYADFHGKAVKGFDSFVSKLREAADAAKSGNVQAITALGTSLNQIKLPDPPKEIQDNAPACRDIAAS